MGVVEAQQAACSRELARRMLARRHLLDFIRYTKPDYEVGWHHALLCRILQDSVQHLLYPGAARSVYGDRLIIKMPPRHGKTEAASKRFPAFCLGVNPNLRFIATSYSAELSSSNNRDVQRVIDSDLYPRLFPKTSLYGSMARTTAKGSYLRNSDIFEVVGHKGSYRSSGRGGAITGYGGEVILVDDPLKNREEAESASIRESLWDWYKSTVRTRAEPGCVIIVIQTAWHSDDLAGKLIKLAKQDPEADQWNVISFPAIAEAPIHADDPRTPGQALWEAKYPLPELLRIKASVGEYDWAALYQQHPRPREGGMIKSKWVQRYTTAPQQFDCIIQSWDTAQKAAELNNPWSGTCWGVKDGRFYLLDVHTQRHEYPAGKKAVINFAVKWNPSAILIEDKSTGSTLLQELREPQLVEGRQCYFSVIPILPCQDKVTRMSTETSAIEAGRFYLPKFGSWLLDYESVLFDYPSSAISDPIDSTSQFLRYMRERGTEDRTAIATVGSKRVSSNLSGY